MKRRLFFASIVLSIATWALQARAADFVFPSVPVGQSIVAEFRLTTPGGAPVPGIDVSLRVPAGCGSVFPDRVTTDSLGTGRFNFFAGIQPGVCTITGSNGGTTLSAVTTIFRPEELVVGGTALIDDMFWHPGSTNFFGVTLSAGGLPLPLVAVGLGQFGAGGPTVRGGTQVATDASGALKVDVTEGSTAGIYDLPMSVAGETRHLRMIQRTLSDDQVQHPYKQLVGGSNDPALVIFPDGAAGSCAMGAPQKSVQQLFGPPPGTVDFFNDLIDLNVTCAGAHSEKVRIEYPDPIPPDGLLMWYRYTPGTGFRWEPLPAVVSGNALTFTIPEFVDRGVFLQATIGFALPGTGPAAAPPRVHDMWWGGLEENGWGMSIVQKPGVPSATFAAIFAYDDAGEPTWWVMTLGDWVTGRGPQFTAPAYSPLGSPWFAYEAGIIYVGDPPAGRARLRFSDANNGELSFTLHGISSSKAIQRMLFGPPSSVVRPDVSGLWWGGYAQNGWGISVLQQNEKLFSIWYTYDAANKPRWFVMPDGRWSSATTWEGRIYRVQSSRWLGAIYDASRLRLTDVGAFTMNFTAGASTFSYSMEGRSGTMRIERNTSY